MSRGLALAIATLTFTTTAHADSRAWTVGKKVLPADLMLVAGLNADPIRSSQLFKQMLPKAVQNSKEMFDKVKTICSVDLIEQVDSVVVGATAAEQHVFVVALKSTNRKELDACVVKFGKHEKKPMTITEDGQVTKYSRASDEYVYVRWLAKDAVAFSSAPQDKDLLLKLTDGGVADDKAFKAPLAAVKTTSAIWGVVNKTQDLDQVQAKMHSAYGSADIKGGTLSADVHIVVADAKSASDAAASATAQIDLLKKSGKVPAEYQGLLSAVKFSASGSEILVNASAAEKDVLAVLANFMH